MKTTVTSRFLWFERANKYFAVSMDHLQEVLPAPILRSLPVAEPALTGLITLREHVLPIFDPASLASAELSPAASSPIVIVLGLEGRPELGLLAEKVGKVVDLPAPTPLTFSTRLSTAFSGESSIPGLPRLLILDAIALAAMMGLADANPSNPQLLPVT